MAYVESFKNIGITSHQEISLNATEHKLKKKKDVHQFAAGKKSHDTLKSDNPKKEKTLVSKNGNAIQYFTVPKGEIYTAEIDGYIPLLLIVAIVFLVYYGKSKKKSSH